MIDNHVHHSNELRLDPRRVTWRRVMDMNDRALRQVVIGLGGPANGYPTEAGFDITVASEVMAIFCLSRRLQDLQAAAGRIVVGYTREGEPVTAAELKAPGAMTVLLKDALKPNLVQTLENNPALIHGGPFANIAHGCNCVIATKAGAAAGGLRGHRGGLRCRPGRREVFQYQVPQGGPATRRGGAGGNGAGAENARRRAAR